MRLEIFTICDAATESGGKLNILGSFDTIFSKQAPIIHPTCAIAAGIRFEKIEQGVHRVKATVANQDGRLVVPPFDAGINVVIPESISSIISHLIINLQPLKLDQFGEYTIDISIDGRHEGSIPLFVRQAPVVIN